MSRSQINSIALPLAIALVAGLLAAWLVRDQLNRAKEIGGQPVNVLVASQRIAAGATIAVDELDSLLTERSIPVAFAPVDAILGRQQLGGATLLASIEPGTILTRPLLASRSATADYRLRGGERAVSIAARPAPDGTVLAAGDQVDLIASGFDGAPSSELVLAGAQVLSASESDRKPGQQRLTLRVAARQTAGLVRADVFAREVRAIQLSSRGR